MPPVRHVVAVLAVLVAVVVPVGAFSAAGSGGGPQPIEAGGARYRFTAAEAKRDGARLLTRKIEDASLTFAPGTDPGSQQAVRTAIASARPEARRLIDMVDGLVTIRVGPTGESGAVGLTQLGDPDGYPMTLDIATVYGGLGQRGVDRLVLHELGHVVDHALIPAALDAQLAAGVPTGYGCDQGVSGACATRDERFAESFAKWAMNDIGVDLNIGYKIMPPEPSLDAWGAPLAKLGS
jgi:hypothetical protein